MRAGDHCCVSYATDAEQQDIVAAYVGDGLANNDKVAYFSAGDPAVVKRSLAARGLPVQSALDRGQLLVVAPEDGYLATRPLDPDVLVERLHGMVADAHAEGYRTLRATGEVHAVLDQRELLLDYERKVTAVYADKAMGLCQYDRRRFAPAELAGLEAVHPRQVGPNPLYSDDLLALVPTYSPNGVRLVGEVDITHTLPGNDEVIRALDGVRHDLHLDLSGLRFLDVAGARLLARIARHLDRHGALLFLHRPGPRALTVLRLTGWDRLRNVVVESPDLS